MLDLTREFGMTAYGLAALACLAAARRGRRVFWGGLGLLHVLLAFEVDSGLRFKVTLRFRSLLREVSARAKFDLQLSALLGVCLFLAAAAWLAVRVTRRRGWSQGITIPGTALSIAAWLTEAISLHGTAPLLYRHVGPAAVVGWVWVLGGSLVLAGGMAFALRGRPDVEVSRHPSRGIDGRG